MQGGTYHSPTVREEGKRKRARLRFRNQLTSPGTKHWFCSLVIKSICAQCKVSAGVYLQPPSQGPQPLLWYFGTLYTIQLGNLTSSHPICCQHWGSSSGVTLFYTCLWKPSTPYQHLPVKYFGFFFTTGIIITTQIFFHQLATGAK